MRNERSLVDFFPHPAAIIDESGRVVSVNHFFFDRFGTKQSGDPITEVIADTMMRLCGWQPSGSWRDDRIVLERGVQCHTGQMRVLPMGANRLVFVLTDKPTAAEKTTSTDEGRDRALVSALMESSDSALFLVDDQGKVIEHNSNIQVWISTGTGVIIGTPIDDLLTLTQSGRPVRPMTLVRHVLRTGRESGFGADISLVTVDGTSYGVEVGVVPLKRDPVPAGQNPLTGHVLMTIRNIEEKRRVRSDLRYLQHAENITRAVGGVAHEITNGCTALFGQIDLIRAENSEDLATLYSAVRRIQHLGFRLGGFSRNVVPVREENEEELVPAVTGQVDETIINTVDLALSGTSVRATFGIATSTKPLAIAPDRLSQVLFNVLTNAVEAMAEGGVVHVETAIQKKDDLLRIIVRDEGHGMDPRTYESALKPYFTTKERGIGMGLTVAASILEECDGTLEISTEPGFGTTVEVLVPIYDHNRRGRSVRSRIPKSSSSGLLVEHPDLTGLEVLLVEDDLLVRRAVERSLVVLGCNVVTVENGERALHVMQEQVKDGGTFGLLITDLAMPGRLNGVRLLHRIRELDSDIPAILSTGALHSYPAVTYRTAGFQAVLHKPFGLEQLKNSIYSAFAGRT